MLVAATIFVLMFLPGLFLGLISSWHRGILKTIIKHPSIVLLPAFTHFTFASSSKLCQCSSKEEGKEEDEEEKEGEKAEEPFIIFSAKFTLLNLLLSTAGHVVYGLSMTHISGCNFYITIFYLVFGVPTTILGFLFTLLSLALTSTRKTCCIRTCCCTCFALPKVESLLQL